MSKLICCWVVIICLVVFSCQPEKSTQSNGLANISDTKVLQYAIPGKKLYDLHCANCHQEDGVGLGRLIPPLNPSDYMSSDVSRTVKLIKYGMKGEIEVNGIIYDGIMPANPKLTNMEIAQISTYIYNVWGNNKGLIEAGEVEKILNE
jgi:cytochrome c551